MVKGAPDAQLRSLHVQRDPTAYSYIKVGGQIKVLHHERMKTIYRPLGIVEKKL